MTVSLVKIEIMANGTVHIILPVGQAVVKNVTQDFETRLLHALMEALQAVETPSKQNNIVLLAFIFCLTLLTLIVYVVKHPFFCKDHAIPSERNAS